MSTWYERGVFYHMYPLGMTGAPKHNDATEVTNRFEELDKWISHIRSLGANAIYIGPLFESTSHGYDTRDYKLVDPRLGDNGSFRKFVDQCHQEGIKVVVDGVFNHTGREFFAFKDIQEKRWDSPYKDWYKGVNFDWQSPCGDSFGYEAWQGHFELPCLNLFNPDVRSYLFDVIRFWIDEFDIDGIRLDCANVLDFNFMKEMRSQTEAMKEDFWLMGEVIHGDYSRYIRDGQSMLHSVTNYELHKGLYSGHNDHNYFEIAHTIRREFDENGGIYKGMKLYSFVDNHDVDRIISKINVKEHIYPIYTLLFTLPGIPSVYYGSEWGIEGRKEGGNDNPLRPAAEIEKVLEEQKDSPIMHWFKWLGEMHKTYRECLAYGRYRELLLTNRQYAFARFTDNQALLVAVNNDEQETEVSISVPFADKVYINLETKEKVPVENGRVQLRIKPAGSILLGINI